MMKTLISSFFTFLLIYIQGLEISRLPQVFFKNIKMRPKYNKKVITTYYFAMKVVIVIDNMWLDVILNTGCVTFNRACVFMVCSKNVNTVLFFDHLRSQVAQALCWYLFIFKFYYILH